MILNLFKKEKIFKFHDFYDKIFEMIINENIRTVKRKRKKTSERKEKKNKYRWRILEQIRERVVHIS